MKQVWQEQLPVNHIQRIQPVSGGDVNQAYKVETADDTYFLLVQPNRSEDFYAAEIAGLEKFEEAGITAPQVVGSGEIEGDAYLLLTYLEEGGRGDQRDLAKLVAKMHSNQQPEGRFGFEMPHEGGDHSFDNDWCDTWSELFINQRMDVLCEGLIEQGNGLKRIVKRIKKCVTLWFKRLSNIVVNHRSYTGICGAVIICT